MPEFTPTPRDEKRAALAHALEEAAREADEAALSPGQERLWFLNQLEPDVPLYNLTTAVRLRGTLDIAVLREALTDLVARHQVLRSIIISKSDGPVQLVNGGPEFELETTEFPPLTEGERDGALQAALRAELNHRFALNKGPLFRAHLLRLTAQDHVLVLNMHHIVSDEWSVRVMFRDLQALYTRRFEGKIAELPELPIEYADFAEWHHEHLRTPAAQRQLEYWKGNLEGLSGVTELMPDHARPVESSFRGGHERLSFPADLAPKLQALAGRAGVTPFTLFFGVFGVLIHRYTGLSDLVIGSPFAGRTRAEAENLAGFFVNTLPLRLRFDNNPSFNDYLRSAREVILNAASNQEISLEKIVDAMRPERGCSHMPFTRVLFAVQQEPPIGFHLPGTRMEWLELEPETAKFDLTLNIRITDRGCQAVAEYSRDVFEPETMTRLLRHFQNLLESVVKQPNGRVSELSLLSEAEEHELVAGWNQTRTDYPRNRSVSAVFENVVVENPNSTALSFAGRTLTYAELNARANQLARWLRRRGTPSRMPVGLCVNRSPEMIVGMLGILKAGAAYMPLDPDYPRARLEVMLRESGATLVLTQQAHVSKLPAAHLEAMCLDADWELAAAEPGENLEDTASAEALAYVMYTSGSTGTPKGVAVPHRAILRLVLGANYLQITRDDRVPQVSHICFDAATFEIWGTLLNGATLVGIDQALALSPREFARELREQRVSVMFLTTALLNQLISEAPDALHSLRTVMAGGEPHDIKWVRLALESGAPERFLNVYGPTENTTFTTFKEIRDLPRSTATLPIGKPISNTQVFILDARMKPVPVGVPGELFTGGDGLALGYWQQPELTRERFIANPFAHLAGGARLYRTGDRARFLPNGDIEFLGRKDNQVKLRGFRIELGEIEATLARHPGIEKCVVAMRGSESGQKKLVAYYVSSEGKEPNPSAVRTFLEEQLPSYMVPAAYLRLDALPLTPHGKIDRRGLPEPDSNRPEMEADYTRPRDAVERDLTQIWERVLGVAPIGVQDRFFELGGHSLLAVTVINEMEKAFGKKLRVATIFQAQTIAQLAQILRDEKSESALREGSALVEIQGRGSNLPLFLVHGAGGGMFWGYVNLARHLGPEQPVYGFKAHGLDGAGEYLSIPAMAAAYVRDLRKLQPTGPYRLGGYCFGGNVAYEMAHQLESAGESVGLVVLMNCAPPNSSYTHFRLTPGWAVRFLRNLVYWAGYFRQWTPAQRKGFFRWKATAWRRRWRRFGLHPQRRHATVDAGDLVDLSTYTPEQRRIWENHIRALVEHEPKRIGGKVTLFRSPGHPLWCSFARDYGWGEWARGGVEVRIVSGTHEKILEEPCAAEVGESLRGLLAGPAIPREPGGALDEPPTPPRPESEFSIATNFLAHFESQVERTPDAPAAWCDGRNLTYRSLSNRVNNRARQLRRLGIGREKLAAVCLDRSFELLESLLAIWKAGGAYVPLDPNYPVERLRYMLRDAQAQVLITSKKHAALFPESGTLRLLIDAEDTPAETENEASPRTDTDLGGEELAYVMYTSGSTGLPKGVAITHRSLLNHNFGVARIFNLTGADRVLQFAPISFDISVEEIFPTLLTGGTVVLRSDEVLYSVDRFLDFVIEQQITVLNLPTAYWHELVESFTRRPLPDCVRLVVIGGEKASEETFRRWQAQAGNRTRLINTYGPTETTVSATYYEAQPGADSFPIGKPLPNVAVFVLDERRQPVPAGTTGELYIGGEGVARGYLNRPELTAEKFVSLAELTGGGAGRLYRTGDLVRYRADGNLEFVGRADQQVKIRGFRIEPGEIESVLREQPEVKDAVVVVREERPGHRRLVAYVVPREGSRFAVRQLRERLTSRLPEYMVPVAFQSLRALPLSPAGKLDRNALPAPEETRRDPEAEYVPPRDATEAKLAELWVEVLGGERPGVHDNFFDAGGHSLAALRLVARVREAFGKEVAVPALFEAPTIETLAQALGRQSQEAEGSPAEPIPRAPRQGPMPVSFVQERLWFLDQLQPGTDAYNVPWAAWLEGELNRAALEKAWQALLNRHEILRTTFTGGDEGLRQVVGEPAQRSFAYHDFTSRPESQARTVVERFLTTGARQPFDLRRGPLARAVLVQAGPQEHAFSIVLHHAVADGWSLGTLLEELGKMYNAFASGEEPQPSNNDLQYADFAAWLRDRMQGRTLEGELEYWKSRLKGAPASIILPRDRPAAAGERPSALRHTVIIPDPTPRMQANREFRGTTLFMWLMSGLAITLHRWSRQTDMVLGTVVAGRTRREFERVLGCFMNFLPVRTQVRGNESALTVLRRTRATILEAQAHQECPFERIVEAINPERKLNENPLYNVALLLQNYPEEQFPAEGLEVTPVACATDTPLLDLRFEASEKAGSLEITCESRADLFKQETIAELMRSYAGVLELLLERPETRVEQCPLTPALEGQRMETGQERQTLAVCATFTAEPLEEPLRWWMRELGISAEVGFAPYNQVFQELLNPTGILGSNPAGLNILLVRLEDWVGGPSAEWTDAAESKLRRSSADFVEALRRAAAKSKAPYVVCLTPPSNGILAKPARARLVSELELEIQTSLKGASGIYVLTDAQLRRWYPVDEPNDASADALGHVPYSPLYYTALATGIARKFHTLWRGEPKVIVLDCDQTLWSGVCGEDGAGGIVIDETRRYLQEFILRQHDAGRLLCACSKNNESDVREVFAKRHDMPLKAGHFAAWRLNWDPKSRNLASLAAELNLGLDAFVFIDDNPVECAEVEARCAEVLTLQLPEDPSRIPDFLDHCWIFDHLQTTFEDRRRTEMYRQNAERDRLRARSLSLGDFLAELELKITIERMTSEQVSRVAQLTQKTNQFNCTTKRRTEGEILSLMESAEILTAQVTDRFGDYGLVGVVVFAERRGSLEVDTFLLSCRVLGRGVEHRILAHLGQLALERHAAWVDVRFIPSEKNRPALAFLESVGGPFKQPTKAGSLFRFPAAFAATVTLNPDAAHPAGAEPAPAATAKDSGVGRRQRSFPQCRAIALEAGNIAAVHQRIMAPSRRGLRPGARDLAPRTGLERQLCTIWEQLLRLDKVGVRDDFFALGGHSLLAVRLFAQIEELTGRKLPLITIFQARTVEELARALGDASQHGPSLLVPIQPNGTRPPLFLVHGAGGDVLWGYANLAGHLGEDQPVYGIRSRGQTGGEEFSTIPEMAAGYVKEVRGFQPAGPYYLGGYCFGGNVAYEMARQLSEAGEEVALVALLDAAPANAGYERVPWWDPRYPVRFARNLGYWLNDFRQLPGEARGRFVKRKAEAFYRKLRGRLLGNPGQQVDLDEVIDVRNFPEQDLKLWQAHLNAMSAHVDRPYKGRLVLLRTRGQPLFSSLKKDFCWGQLAQGGVDVRFVAGSHEQIFMEPNVRALAAQLSECLERTWGEKRLDHSTADLAWHF